MCVYIYIYMYIHTIYPHTRYTYTHNHRIPYGPHLPTSKGGLFFTMLMPGFGDPPNWHVKNGESDDWPSNVGDCRGTIFSIKLRQESLLWRKQTWDSQKTNDSKSSPSWNEKNLRFSQIVNRFPNFKIPTGTSSIDTKIGVPLPASTAVNL